MARQKRPSLGGAEFFTGIAFMGARWWFIITTVVGGLMSSYAAFVTNALQPYAPFSWVAAGIMAALLVACALLAAAKAADVIAHWNFVRKLAAGPAPFNPLSDHFERQQIKLADFRNPFNLVHSGKTFINCEIIGPGVIFFTGNSVLQDIGFINCDCVAVREGAFVQNLMAFDSAVLRGGKIYGATVLFPASKKDELSKQIPNMAWIT